ncbi:flagellar assembly peptidoglycan hydrolase FlgJ [Bradyrhizobium sp. Tv2a-2]|uniref:flagellar assembly peptidoglycan hydrolase FlgJ n=1 Tax=Bradyrhizobium sp. Tv2a-2 TaxID=113395 RepID=UPI000417A001|nr:flagellar assembly peptidoglycan hydrolase FlgJ [Bradyrhizobium sp. Tv2a-2]
MQISTIASSAAASAYAGKSGNFVPTAINGRPDLDFAAALQQVPPRAQAKAKATATDFEAMFLNSMFSQMTSGLKGEGPFGDTVGTGVWRSMLTEQYSRSFAKAGGVGIANEVYRTLIMQQARTASGDPASAATTNNASKSTSQ